MKQSGEIDIMRLFLEQGKDNKRDVFYALLADPEKTDFRIASSTIMAMASAMNQHLDNKTLLDKRFFKVINELENIFNKRNDIPFEHKTRLKLNEARQKLRYIIATRKRRRFQDWQKRPAY